MAVFMPACGAFARGIPFLTVNNPRPCLDELEKRNVDDLMKCYWDYRNWSEERFVGCLSEVLELCLAPVG